MNKLTYAALIASGVSASDAHINVFAPQNFLTKNLVQSLIKSA